MKKLYEITAMVTYSVVISAESAEAALAHVESWEHAWDASADLIGVSDVEVADVRDPISADTLDDEAHEVV